MRVSTATEHSAICLSRDLTLNGTVSVLVSRILLPFSTTISVESHFVLLVVGEVPINRRMLIIPVMYVQVST